MNAQSDSWNRMKSTVLLSVLRRLIAALPRDSAVAVHLAQSFLMIKREMVAAQKGSGV